MQITKSFLNMLGQLALTEQIDDNKQNKKETSIQMNLT